jgi:hypothetical protein
MSPGPLVMAFDVEEKGSAVLAEALAGATDIVYLTEIDDAGRCSSARRRSISLGRTKGWHSRPARPGRSPSCRFRPNLTPDSPPCQYGSVMRIAFRGNIIVWNLPENFTEAELAALFDDHGLVLGAAINRRHPGPDGSFRGLVNLAPAKAVDEAVQAVDGRMVAARKLRVRRARDEPSRAAKKPAAAPAGHGGGQRGLGGPGADVRPQPATPRRPVVVEQRSMTGRRYRPAD